MDAKRRRVGVGIVRVARVGSRAVDAKRRRVGVGIVRVARVGSRAPAARHQHEARQAAAAPKREADASRHEGRLRDQPTKTAAETKGSDVEQDALRIRG